MDCYQYGYYTATRHLVQRYRQRMSSLANSEHLKKEIKSATQQQLTRRANFMLLFSIHGKPGKKPNTEVRYYFDWNIVVDNVTKEIITLYKNVRRAVPAITNFGSRRLRTIIYDLMFRPNSKVARALYAAA
jgi:hypothetical protein